jgi:hypothetical protein
MKKRTLFILIAVSALAAVHAESARAMPPVAVNDSQALGFGGPHVAYTDTVFGLFTNPAAIQRLNQKNFFELSLSVPQLFDILSRRKKVDSGSPASYINLFTENNGTLKFGPGVSLQFPLAISYVANGFGFGFWDQIAVDTRILNSELYLGLRADFIASVGISTSVVELLGHSVDVGVAIKPFVRVMTDGVKPVDATEFISNIDNFNVDTLLKGAGIPVIAGMGVDAGIMYRYRKWASFGISFNDIVTRGSKVADLAGNLGIDGLTGVETSTYYVPFTLNIGAAGSVRLSDFFSNLPNFIKDSYLAIMFDWRDVLNQHWGSNADDFIDKNGNEIRNPILNLSFGAEVGLFRFLRIRGGISEMLPSFGLGFHFGGFQIATSIYGVELGNEPGQFSTYAVNLTISVRPESKKKTWPWTGPLVNKIMGIN